MIDEARARQLRLRDLRMQQERVDRQASVIGRYQYHLETRLAEAERRAKMADHARAVVKAAEELADGLQHQQALDLRVLAALQQAVADHRRAGNA